MKYLSASGVTHLWSKIDALVQTKQNKLVSGTNIKTVNGESILGSGNISIDLTLLKVVTELPTSNIDETKIYLVSNSQTSGSNIYTEYVYTGGKWEILGEYKSDIDLTPYAKTEDVNAALALKADKSDTYTKDEVDSKVKASGTFSDEDATKLAGIEAGAEVNVIETVKVDGTALAVSSKAVNIDLSGKVDKVSGKGLSTNDYTTTEKNKLAAIASGAEVNQNAFTKVVVGSATVVADAKEDTLTLAAGDNVTIVADAETDKVTISATDTTYSAATTSADGLMSATDKSKLDAIAAAATADSALTDAEIDAAIAAA